MVPAIVQQFLVGLCGFPVDALYDSTVQLLHSRDRAVAAVFALQPRKFPMTAALQLGDCKELVI
jgi:hypothetical protein